MYRFRALIFLALLSWAAVLAVPTFESYSANIGSLIPGLSSIQALRGGQPRDNGSPRHLDVRSEGGTGNLTLTTVARARPEEVPLYYIHRNRLWRYMNDTTIYAVNVVNTTQTAYRTSEMGLQLVQEEKPGGITAGKWSFKGSMLMYTLGESHNSGVYYDCRVGGAKRMLLTFLKGIQTPSACTLVTLHGFEHDV